MLRIRGHSITNKLTRMNMLVSGAALLLACLAFGAYDMSTFRQAIVHNLSIQAQIAGSNSVSALLFNDPHEAEKTLSALKAAPNILSAHIYTADGLPFAVYSRDRGGEAPALPPIPAGQTEAHWFKNGQIVLVHSIIFQAKPTGSVYIQSDLREINDRLKRGAGIAAIVLLTSLLAALLVSSIFQRAVAEPITHLARIAGLVSRDKDYSVRATPTGGRDELAALIETFNGMLAQIQERDGALREAHNELEQRVQERTTELAEANEQLRSEITERKKSEEALRGSEVKFRGILESAPDAMVIADGQGRIVLVNAETERLFGYRREELVGQIVDILLPERFRGKYPQHREGHTAHPVTRSMGAGLDLGGLRKDNTEFPVEISLSPIETPEGILISSTIRDVTARKTAEEALREAEERFRTLANNISQLAWMADEKGYIFWYNQRWFDYTGTTLEEMAGWGWQAVHHPDHVQQVVARISKCFQSGEVWEDTFPLRGANGNYRWFLSRAVPIRDPEGNVLRWFGTNTDITERKKSEEHLVKTVGELKRSNDELQQFAYVASHDLQEPLRMVASYTQLLAERYKGRLDSDADEFIAYAVDGSNRMQALIQDLLAYSRAGTNGKVLREISSEQALKEALANLRGTIEESGAVVTHDALPAITTDDTQLAQIFQNLVGNAIKYHGSEVPHVHVSATKNGGKEWIFSVRDNGLGIDPQYFERIFIIFQRLHGRKEFEGTGMGLAICKKMLERLGGRIWVESQPEKGSTFYFALPERDGK
jgi:PAS domain S-box-containing protein